MRITRIILVTALALSTSAVVSQAQTAATPKKDTTHAAHATTMAPASSMSHTTPAAGTTAATPVKHWTKEQIEDAQKGLTKAGFYKGPANGTWTHATASAMRAYQRANKLPVTGQLTDEELSKLKAS
jgi:peptidoglycan hydrolase-like protein with peptidoglycan-binding domain